MQGLTAQTMAATAGRQADRQNKLCTHINHPQHQRYPLILKADSVPAPDVGAGRGRQAAQAVMRARLQAQRTQRVGQLLAASLASSRGASEVKGG